MLLRGLLVLGKGLEALRTDGSHCYTSASLKRVIINAFRRVRKNVSVRQKAGEINGSAAGWLECEELRGLCGEREKEIRAKGVLE